MGFAHELKTLLRRLLTVAVVVALAVPALPVADRLAAAHPLLAAWSVYFLLLAAALLGWRFNRSRVVYAAAVVVSLYWLLAQHAHGGPLSWADQELLFAVAAFAAPVSLLISAWVPERGLASWTGLARILALVAQLAAIAGLAEWAPSRAWYAFTTELFPAGAAPDTLLPHPGLAAFAAAIAGLLVRAGMTRELLDACQAGVATAALLACQSWYSPGGPALYTAVSGILLVLPVIQASHDMAYRDELTGLLSRRALRERLLAMPGRYVLALADVDHFKSVNDRYGHDVGDQALRFVAARLRETGGRAVPYRWGGEEFVLVFPGARLAEVLPRLDELRRRTADTPLALRGPGRPETPPARPISPSGAAATVRVTLSIGAAEPDGRRESPEDVLAAADRALYRAKRRGRNRVIARPSRDARRRRR